MFLLLLVGFVLPVSVFAWRLTPPRQRWKGRYISRPLIRLLGSARARILWANMRLARLALVVWFVFFDGPFWPWAVLLVVDAARDVDDWLYSDDDDDDRRERFRARVRLRMPMPVLLRPAERWEAAHGRGAA